MFNKILVAVDGSDSSIKALDYAAHLASHDNAELKMVSAAEPLPPLGIEGTAPSYIPQYQDDLHKSLEKMLKKQEARIQKKYPDLKVTTKVIDGRPATVIRKASKNMDLIVMGHRGQGGILDWMLGSVAKQIVDTCTVPVLVIKDKDYCPS